MGDRTHAKISVRSLARQLGEEFLSLERGVPWTFVQLFRRPGTVLRGYVEGTEARAAPPVRYLVIGMAATLALSALRRRLDADPRWNAVVTSPSPLVELIGNPALGFSIAFVPAFAATVLMMFRSARAEVAEAFVLAAYVTSQGMLTMMLAGFAVTPTALEPMWLMIVSSVAGLLVYPACALASYFDGRAALWRALAAPLVAAFLAGGILLALNSALAALR